MDKTSLITRFRFLFGDLKKWLVYFVFFFLEDLLPAVSAADGSEPSTSSTAGEWFATEKSAIFVEVLVFVTAMIMVTRLAKRGRPFFIRKLSGVTAIEEAVGRATEMGRPVLYVPGIDDVNNIQTIFSLVILESVTKMVATYDTPILVPVCKAFVATMAEQTVKQGYDNAGRPDAFDPSSVRYLSDEQFAYAAGVNGIITREKPAANLYLGSFYAESLLLAETGFLQGAIQVAGTANVNQIPFFVVACDHTLIGEEFFAATSYMSREPSLVGALLASDIFKFLLIILLLVSTIWMTIHQNIQGYHDVPGFLEWFKVN